MLPNSMGLSTAGRQLELLFVFFLLSLHLFIYFLAVLGLCCCVGFSLVEACRLFTAVASLVTEHGTLSTQALGCGMWAQ